MKEAGLTNDDIRTRLYFHIYVKKSTSQGR